MIYEFKCIDCNHEFEQELPLSEYTDEIKCVNCDEMALRHFRTAPQLDTYYPGSFKDQNPVHGI